MTTDLVRKLGYRGGPAVVVDAPSGYDLGIETAADQGAPLAFVQVFVTGADGLRSAVPRLLARTIPDPVFWVTYPKQGAGVPSDLNRDVIARIVGEETEFRVVSNVAIDATWSALRLRRKTLVKART